MKKQLAQSEQAQRRATQTKPKPLAPDQQRITVGRRDGDVQLFTLPIAQQVPARGEAQLNSNADPTHPYRVDSPKPAIYKQVEYRALESVQVYGCDSGSSSGSSSNGSADTEIYTPSPEACANCPLEAKIAAHQQRRMKAGTPTPGNMNGVGVGTSASTGDMKGVGLGVQMRFHSSPVVERYPRVSEIEDMDLKSRRSPAEYLELPPHDYLVRIEAITVEDEKWDANKKR